MILFCALFSFCLASVSAAGAPDGAACADGLYFLGLIQGYSAGGQDFGLDDALTRAQAVVLLERYLGVLTDAETTVVKAPFDDVPDWADSYIGYACEHRLVSGKTDASGKAYFDPDAPVSETEFLTLLLRAMDYTDQNDGSGDFVWSDPYSLSDSLGLTNGKSETFLRGDAFGICWSALGALSKTGKTVAEKLMSAGVFNDARYTYAKRIAAGDTIRVVCVGDSITQGTGAKDPASNSYPSRLQKLLGNGFEVINCGKASAYVMSPDNSFNQKAKTHGIELYYPNTAAYQTAIQANPDVVIIMLGTNDCRNITDSASTAQWISDYKALIADFAALDSNPKIYLSTMIPAVNIELAYQNTAWNIPGLIRSVGAEFQLPVLETGKILHDYYVACLPNGDKIHPNDDTYEGLAVWFYREVFGGIAELPEIPQAENNVVFVSDSGSVQNDGSSPDSAVNRLAYALGMLQETGGTVVICGNVTLGETKLPPAQEHITITSLYDGVDYAKTADAKLSIGGGLSINSDITFTQLTIQATANSQSFYCGYNNVTFGDGINCTFSNSVTVPLTINAGYVPIVAATDKAQVSCHSDCTLTINSGTWAILRGGNRRANRAYAVGSIDPNVKLSVIINGGAFTYTGSSINTGTGMNDLEGELYIEINGGTFTGDFCLIANIGTNATDYTPLYSGKATLKITGGTLNGKLSAYQTSDTKKLAGGTTLILIEQTANFANKALGFDQIQYE